MCIYIYIYVCGCRNGCSSEAQIRRLLSLRRVVLWGELYSSYVSSKASWIPQSHETRLLNALTLDLIRSRLNGRERLHKPTYQMSIWIFYSSKDQRNRKTEKLFWRCWNFELNVIETLNKMDFYPWGNFQSSCRHELSFGWCVNCLIYLIAMDLCMGPQCRSEKRFEWNEEAKNYKSKIKVK